MVARFRPYGRTRVAAPYTSSLGGTVQPVIAGCTTGTPLVSLLSRQGESRWLRRFKSGSRLVLRPGRREAHAAPSKWVRHAGGPR